MIKKRRNEEKATNIDEIDVVHSLSTRQLFISFIVRVSREQVGERKKKLKRKT